MPDNMPPAYTISNCGKRVYIEFVQAANGDLVDVKYYCMWCADQLHIGGEHWPAFQFGDADEHCYNCHTLLNIGTLTRERMYV